MSSDVENSATATAPSDEGEAGAPQRGATRAPIQCPVRLQFDDAIEVVEGRCRNVSIGGMFVRSSEARPKGSLVRFELVLEDQASIRGLAEVVWMRPRDESSGRQAGMGLRFRFLEQRDRQMIFKLVSQHIKERLASRHPSMEETLPERDGEAPEPAPVRTPPPAPEESESARQRSLLFDENRFGDESREEAGPRQDAPVAESPPSTEPVVDEFDNGAERTAAWMNDAVAGTEPDYATYEEGAADGEEYDEGEETGWDGDASWVGGSARVQEEERSPVRILAAVAVLLVLLAVGVYFFGDRLFGGAEDVEPAGEASAGAETRSDSQPDPQPDPQSDRGTETATEPVPAEERAATSEPESSSSSPPAPPPTPRPTRREASAPAAEPSAEPAARTGTAPFRRVRDISVRRVGDVTRVVIETDGAVAADRYSHSRVTTAPPRELIRLRGLTTRFTRETIAVGGPRVSRIRTGWHRKASGNELHVVLDLASPSARVTDLAADGSRLVVTVEGS